jgi:hypothetical protein
MKQNKITTYLSVASISKLASKYKFFTIEKPSKSVGISKIAVAKTLTKVLSKHLKLSKHLDSSNLKYPLIINFFEDHNSFVEYLTLNSDKNNNNIVFMSTGNISFKQNLSQNISSMYLFNRFSSLFDSSVMLLRCLKLSQKS